MDKYMLRPARKILLMENKAKKVENNKFVGEFNSCVGEMQEDFYVVTFTVDGSDVFKKLYFSKDMYILLSDFKNKWIHNPILNRSGLAALVWSPEGENKTPNQLRRRLEQKSERASLSAEEKKIILQKVSEFYKEVENAMKY